MSSNLNERLKDHKWHTVKTTKSAPHSLVWTCIFREKDKALHFERYLKTGSGIAFRNRHLV